MHRVFYQPCSISRKWKQINAISAAHYLGQDFSVAGAWGVFAGLPSSLWWRSCARRQPTRLQMSLYKCGFKRQGSHISRKSGIRLIISDPSQVWVRIFLAASPGPAASGPAATERKSLMTVINVHNQTHDEHGTWIWYNFCHQCKQHLFHRAGGRSPQIIDNVDISICMCIFPAASYGSASIAGRCIGEKTTQLLDRRVNLTGPSSTLHVQKSQDFYFAVVVTSWSHEP